MYENSCILGGGSCMYYTKTCIIRVVSTLISYSPHYMYIIIENDVHLNSTMYVCTYLFYIYSGTMKKRCERLRFDFALCALSQGQEVCKSSTPEPAGKN